MDDILACLSAVEESGGTGRVGYNSDHSSLSTTAK